MNVALPLPRTVAARSLYGLVAIGAAVAAAVVLSPWVLALWLLPDLTLIGAFNPAVRGALLPRAVARYNAAHALPAPVILAAAGLALGAGVVAAIGLVWVSHVTMDRAAGYGLRAADGGQRAV